MTNQPIIYKCDRKHLLATTTTVLETSRVNGLKCIWSGSCTIRQNGQYIRVYASFDFSWEFDWDELKKDGIEGLSGHIIIKSASSSFDPTRIEVDLTENNQTIAKNIVLPETCLDNSATFEYSLTPHRAPIQEVRYDEMFFPSENADAILLVGGKKLHINKTFLSFHSDFFRALFSSKFKEGQMDEIPIQDISYKDFGLVMSIIHPITALPTDETVEKLLELADRLIMPFVSKHVEHHLLRNSKIENKQMIWMADQYGMSGLLEKCIQQIDTKEKAKQLKADPNWLKLSKDTKLAIFDRLMQLI